MRVSCRFSSPEGPGKAAGGLSPEPQGTPPGSTPRRVFPRGLPSEFALVLTLLLKKHTHQNTWYLFQVTDGDGYPQVSQTTTPLPPVALGASSSPSPVQPLSQLVNSGALCPIPSAHPQGYPYPSGSCPTSFLLFLGFSAPS